MAGKNDVAVARPITSFHGRGIHIYLRNWCFIVFANRKRNFCDLRDEQSHVIFLALLIKTKVTNRRILAETCATAKPKAYRG